MPWLYARPCSRDFKDSINRFIRDIPSSRLAVYCEGDFEEGARHEWSKAADNEKRLSQFERKPQEVIKRSDMRVFPVNPTQVPEFRAIFFFYIKAPKSNDYRVVYITCSEEQYSGGIRPRIPKWAWECADRRAIEVEEWDISF